MYAYIFIICDVETVISYQSNVLVAFNVFLRFLHRRNLYQKKKTMNNTDAPAPIATQDVALSDVASLRNWADCAAKLEDFEYKSAKYTKS